jgi:ABC-2 type transport system permease protein
MNIYLHELRSYQKVTIIWICSLVALVVLYLMIYPTFTHDVTLTKKVLSAFPPAVRAGLGIQLDTFFSILGFYSYIFNFVLLAGAIQAMNLGAGIISKEARLKTTDFLLTKPVTRTQVMTSKMLAAITLLVLTNICYIIAAFAAAKSVATESFSLKIFLMISAALFLIQMIFVILGILFAVVIPKIKSVVAFTLPTVFVFFIISTLGSVLGEEKVRYFTPFKFYDSAYIMKHGAYEMRFLAIEVFFLIIAGIASYVIYMKKDVQAVS